MKLSIPPRLRQPRWWIPLATSICATIGVALWVVSSSPAETKVHANNISRNYRACLLTDQHNTQAAAPIWAALQDAAQTTPVNAQRVTAEGTSTASFTPYANSLTQRKCGLIVTVGDDLHDTVTGTAQRNPHQEFLYVGSQPIPLTNVQNISKPSTEEVSKLVQAKAKIATNTSLPATESSAASHH